MRTTLDIDDELFQAAWRALAEERLEKSDSSGLTKTAVVEAALQSLVREHAARRLATMYGAERPGAQRGRSRT